VFIGLWLPNALFAVLVLFIFHRVEQERPVVPEPLTAACRWLLEAVLLKPWQKLSARWQRKHHRRKRPVLPVSLGLLVHANPETRLFHLPDCPQHRSPKSSLQFISVRVARTAGFKPCPRCEQQLK
jgi:hypothetical protein